MLHALLRTGEHPAEFFRERCGDELVCGKSCGSTFSTQTISGADLVTADDIELSARTTPQSPSLSELDGWTTVTVSATNPRGVGVYLRLDQPFEACDFGFTLASRDSAGFANRCAAIDDAILFLAPHETRRVLFDLNLLRPVLSPPFEPGATELTPQLLDQHGPVRLISIRP
jgi:hypothetical protein